MEESRIRFRDKVCLVTGGGSGIGRATCKQLAAERGIVLIIDNNEKAGKETEKMISSSGGRALFCKADVSISVDVQATVRLAIDQWGKIDILVNNAGIMAFKSVVELHEEEWDRVINVNLRSYFLFCKYSLPHMQNGAIINVSSVHAHQTQANLSPYAASKGAIEAFTRALSREYSPSNIRVNCVAPGGVDTPLLWSNPVIKAMKPEDVQYAQPEEIASIICFLASAEASTINGTTIAADKGLLSAL